MSCIKPITISTSVTQKLFKRGFIKTSSMEVPCGRCLPCRIAKQSSLIFLAQKELLYRYRDNQGACFVTLTYDDNHIPINSKGCLTLRNSDLQKFMKRLRRNMEYHGFKNKYKYVCCGEYGDKFSRPHYHIVFLGLSDNEFKLFSKKCWKFGICDVGTLSQGGLRYVCKYMTKFNSSEEVKKVFDDNDCERPFVHHSIGLGKQFILDNIDKIAKDDFMFNINGKKQFYPKYIMKFVSARTNKDYRPIVSKYITKMNVINASKNKCWHYDDYAKEQNYIRYKNNLATLRSKGVAVDDDCPNIPYYVRSRSVHDRRAMLSLSKVALDSIYGDKIPF